MADIDHNRKKAALLAAGNQQSYEDLQAKLGPTFNMDTGDARLAILIDHLVETGVMSEESRVDFEIKFHTKVEESLDGVWAQVREAEKKKPNLSVVKKPTTLLGPNGRPI